MTWRALGKLPRYLSASGPSDWTLLLEAFLALAAVRLLFGLLPFRLAIRLLGLHRVEQGNGAADVPATPVEKARAMALSSSIARVARHAPFRAVCLQQAFACTIMLRRRGLPVAVRFGVTKCAGGALKARAWSFCGDAILTGASGAMHYTALATFSRAMGLR